MNLYSDMARWTEIRNCISDMQSHLIRQISEEKTEEDITAIDEEAMSNTLDLMKIVTTLKIDISALLEMASAQRTPQNDAEMSRLKGLICRGLDQMTERRVIVLDSTIRAVIDSSMSA